MPPKVTGTPTKPVAPPKSPKAPVVPGTKPANTSTWVGPTDTFEVKPRTGPMAEDAITTVFTPGDEARKLELAQLDAIISARKADPKTYPAESNPYRIEYAVYNLTDPEVVKRLGEASKSGVRVQVLIDAKSVGPSKWWSTVVKDLQAAGFSYAKSQLGLTQAQLEQTNLIGMTMPGLFHLKSRYFSYPDPQTGKQKEVLLTGSHNPELAANANDESLHEIDDAGLIHQYLGAIEAMRDNKAIQNAWNPDSPVNALFASPVAKGPKIADKLLEMINSEKEAIFLSVFTLRNVSGTDKQQLVDRLAAAKARGVKVVVITDRKQSDGVDSSGQRVPANEDDKTDDLLKKAGIPTYEALNTAGPYNAMHLKAAVFGLSDMKVVTDTGNWTFSTMGSGTASGRNAESVLFIDSGKLDHNHTGEQYLAEFCRVLRKYGPQSPDQPDVEALLADLQRDPAWPKVKVDFDVVARTHLGQDVYVTGNTPELGRWGDGGPGVKLDTDARTYPNWKKAEVELPLGARLEYKVVKRNPDGRVDWEPGQNAVLIVDPTAAGSTDAMAVHDDFNGDR